MLKGCGLLSGRPMYLYTGSLAGVDFIHCARHARHKVAGVIKGKEGPCVLYSCANPAEAKEKGRLFADIVVVPIRRVPAPKGWRKEHRRPCHASDILDDRLRRYTAWPSFRKLVETPGYMPTLRLDTSPNLWVVADAYDFEMKWRGDRRRALRGPGEPRRYTD